MLFRSAVAPATIIKGASAGLAVFGDRANHLALLTDGRTIQVWSEQKGQRRKVAETAATAGGVIRLRIACIDGSTFRFAVQGGGTWTELAGATEGSALPPWDRGVRVGVHVEGAAGAAASFDYFSMMPGAGQWLAP